MKYTQLSEDDIISMLKVIGVNSIEELFNDLPASLTDNYGSINNHGMTEMELRRKFHEYEKKNGTGNDLTCFLGGGYYDHFIPSISSALSSRSEFYTAYTPYQPEAAQGSLQLIWEFQSMMSELTGLPVTNASMYDGASGFAEAFLMAFRLFRGKKKKFIYSSTVNPAYIAVLKTYLQFKEDIEIVEIPEIDGHTDIAALKEQLDENTAGVGLSYPNFYGQIEDMEEMTELIKAQGAIPIAAFYPMVSSVLKTPGELGFEIVTGNGQSMGNPIYFSGPTFGIFSVKKEYIRQLPGRLVSETVDLEGKRGFVMTLQTREQHIKRERATSNICSNQSLNTLLASIYMSFVGREGFYKLGQRIMQLTAYTVKKAQEAGIKIKFRKKRIFNEIVFDVPDPAAILSKGIDAGLAPGIPLEGLMRENGLMTAITEKRTKEEIDTLVEFLKGDGNG
ncbi:aminomethyl-transferring glycine dehydrogenase subunit GcvPA [bacterium]|nr:aminomethyl-transferring glycine dehydrogenase subunit GcvPA [bacterium]